MGRRHRLLGLVALSALVAVVGIVLTNRIATSATSAPPASAATPAPSPSTSPSPTASVTPTPSPSTTAAPATPEGAEERNPSKPVRLEVPAIGVDAPVIELGLNPDDTLEVPEDFATTGWWSGGPRPGQLGPAVIAGHVDSKSGPAVFYRLRELAKGDAIRVHERNGATTTFTVERIERHPKDEFPTDAVYRSDLDRHALRLITCGGTFDRSTGHYRDNVIVFATLDT
jgi:LPXTG-site transpeptidase (sortase) family protein